MILKSDNFETKGFAIFEKGLFNIRTTTSAKPNCDGLLMGGGSISMFVLSPQATDHSHGHFMQSNQRKIAMTFHFYNPAAVFLDFILSFGNNFCAAKSRVLLRNRKESKRHQAYFAEIIKITRLLRENICHKYLG